MLKRKQARYDEPQDDPGGDSWGMFIRGTLAKGDAAAVGLLVNEGLYSMDGLVRLRGAEMTYDSLTRLENDVLYVFA